MFDDKSNVADWIKDLLSASFMPSLLFILAYWLPLDLLFSISLGGMLQGLVGFVDMGLFLPWIMRRAVFFMIASFGIRFAIFVVGCLYLERQGCSIPGVLIGFFLAYTMYTYSKFLHYSTLEKGGTAWQQN